MRIAQSSQYDSFVSNYCINGRFSRLDEKNKRESNPSRPALSRKEDGEERTPPRPWLGALHDDTWQCGLRGRAWTRASDMLSSAR